MVKRPETSKKYKKHLLITSLVLASVIFLAGIALGWTLDHFRVNEVLDTIKQNELDTESYLVEQEFIKNFGGDSCELLSPRVTNLQSQITIIGHQLSKWGESSRSFKQQDFDYLKRKYFILETRAFMLIEGLKDTCGVDYNTILYFYSIDDEESLRQGYVLDELVRKYDNLIVLSIDKDYTDEPLIDVLNSKYEITAAPTIVVNSNVKLEGFIPRAQIESLIK